MTASMGRLDPSLHAKLKVKAPEGEFSVFSKASSSGELPPSTHGILRAGQCPVS